MTKLTTPQPGVTTNRYHMVRVDLDVPTRVTNASSKEPLQLPKWEPARRGADDFRKYRSRGAGC